MAFKPKPQQPQFNDLLVSLANSGAQVKSNALYQTVFLLIQRLTQSRDLIVQSIEGQNGQGGILNATYVTVDDESALLQNSWQIVAGPGITLDTSVEGQLVISVTGGSHYDSPLTDGNFDEADLIFANGDPIIVQVPVP